jgi:1-deoxy-D-xylulose-5-phosphate reductoisomerase
MRVPISFALTYPDREATDVPALDLTAASLTFEPPDLDAFPLLRLAREAGEAGGTAPCAFNAANEVAVRRFLDGELPFLGIAEVVARVLVGWDAAAVETLDELVAVDARARELAAAQSAEAPFAKAQA